MAERPTYPKLSTASNFGRGSSHPARNGVPRNASPPDSSRRPSASTDPMSRKRSGSRGNSPADKRLCSVDFNRYAAPGNQIAPFSPPPSRHNSVTGIDVSASTGLGPKIGDGRLVDQYRSSQEKDTRRDSMEGRVTNGTRGHIDTASPSQYTNSPLSMVHGEGANSESGSSTPLHVAPPVPSMFPVAPNSATTPNASALSLQYVASLVNQANAEMHMARLRQHADLPESRSNAFNTIRKMKARKQAIATAELETFKKSKVSIMSSQIKNTDTSGANGLPASQDHTRTNLEHAEMRALQIEISKLKKDNKDMEARMKELEKPTDVTSKLDTLMAKYQELEAIPKKLEQLGALSTLVKQLEAKQFDLDKWKQSQPASTTPDQFREIAAVTAQQAIQTAVGSSKDILQKEIDGAKAEINTLRLKTDSVAADIPPLLTFKDEIKEQNYTDQLGALRSQVGKINASKSTKDKQVDELDTRTKKLDHDLSEFTTSIKQSLASLEDQQARTSDDVVNSNQNMDKMNTRLEEVAQLAQKSSQPASSAPNVVADAPDGRTKESFAKLELDVEGLQQRTQDIEGQTQELYNDVQAIKMDLADAIANICNPLLADMEKNMRTIFDQIIHQMNEIRTEQGRLPSEHTADVNNLQSDHSSADRQQSQQSLGGLNELLRWQKAMDIRVNDIEVNVYSAREQAQNNSKRISESDERNVVMVKSFRNLENRYQNITTEGLHQQMVHWITQNYPNAPGFLEKLNALQQDVKNWITRNIWIEQHSDKLIALLKNHQPLVVLAQNTQRIEEILSNVEQIKSLPQTVQRLDSAQRDAETTLAKAGETSVKVNEQVGVLDEVGSNLHSLRETLRESSEVLAKERNARRELESAFGDEIAKKHEEWKNSFVELWNTSKGSTEDIQALTKRVDEFNELVKSVASLDVEELKRFGREHPLMQSEVAQIKQLVESINQNLPNGPLKFAWWSPTDNSRGTAGSFGAGERRY